MERLQKILANAGICSRRKAEDLIAQGKVTVNGRQATVGQSADKDKDAIMVDGKPLPKAIPRYLILNKPINFETSLRSMWGVPSVMELIKGQQRIIPVGRLDIDSTGLLLFTNDGELAHRIMHPSFPIDKVYEVLVPGSVSDEQLIALRKGVTLDDGERTRPCKIELVSRAKGRSELIFILNEGKKRQIRRMLKAHGHQVSSLRRVRIGPIELGDLKEGSTRVLTEKEIKALKAAVKL